MKRWRSETCLRHGGLLGILRHAMQAPTIEEAVRRVVDRPPAPRSVWIRHLGCRMLPGGCWPQPKLVTHWRKVMRGLGQVGPRRRVDPRMYFVDRSPRIVAFAAHWQQGVAAANGSA